MPMRQEGVRVFVQDDASSELIRIAAAARALRGELDGLSNRTIRIGGSNFGNQTRAFQRDVDAAGNALDRFSGRAGIALDAILGLGPGLIPIGALGVQAIMGLVNAAGALAVTGASAVVAFQGIGDAVSAVDAYQLDPTVANLEKAQEAMGRLGPDAQAFVAAFQDFQPVLTGIRDAAAAGWFPGLIDSLDHFERVAPMIERIFFKSGQAGGGIVESVADSLDSERWRPFMDFIGREAPEAMWSLSRTLGDIAHGVAEMWQAFDPGNDAFLGWLEDVADGFDQWASSAEGREDIAGFLAYARENGPQVQAFFSALVGALSSIVEAAAPLGGPVLSALTAVANVIETIADSDIATPLLAGVAALRAYQRLAPLVTAQQTRLNAAMAPMRASQNPGGMIGPHTAPWLAQALREQERQRAQAARLQAAMRGGAMAAGAGFLASGAAGELNMTNAAMGALIGTMTGPWGAAAGAATGFLLDLRASAKAASEEMAAFDNALAGGASLPQLGQAAQAQREQLDEYLAGWDGVGNALKTTFSDPGAFYDVLDGNLDRLDGYASSAGRASDATQTLGVTFLRIGAELGGDPLKIGDVVNPDLEKAQLIAEQVKPAIDELGYSFEDISKMDSGQLQAFVEEVARLTTEAAKPVPPLEAMSTALTGLGNEGLPAAERASMLGDALDALIDPALNAEAATDAWRMSLKTLRTELNADAGFKGYSDGALANKEATRQYTDSVKQRLVAMVQAGAGEREMMRATRAARAEFIESGIAAGMSRKEITKRANEMGLTPKLVRTVFEAVGLVDSTIKAEAARAIYQKLGGKIQTHVALNGVPQSKAAARQLADELDATTRERRLLVRLADLASGPAKKMGKEMDNAARPRSAKLNADGSQAISEAGRVRAAIGSIRDRTVSVHTVYSSSGSSRSFHSGDQTGADGGTWLGSRFAAAGGGTVPGKLHPYGDKVYAFLAPGEEVISNRYGQADRHRALLKAINANRFASGGTVSRMTGSTGNLTLDTSGLLVLTTAANEAAGGLKGLRRRLKESESALQAEISKRSSAQSLKAEVSTSLAGDLFGNGVAGYDLAVAANQNDAKAMLTALKKAQRKGLDGPLLNRLAASGDLNLVQQFANLSRAEIAQREKQYGSMISTQNALGDYAVEQKYGESIDSMSEGIRHLNQTIRRLEKQIDKMGDKVKQGAHQGTLEGNKAKNRLTLASARAGGRQ